MNIQDLIIKSTFLIIMSFGYYILYPNSPFLPLYSSLTVIGCLSYFFAQKTILVCKDFSLKANLFGKDINKKGTPEGEKKIPEALGIAPASVFFVVNSLLVLYSQSVSDQFVLQHMAGNKYIYIVDVYFIYHIFGFL
ncbi:hypothetical protein PPERSA_02369 [Pseudocohnilembus persalinus]|uniref:Uncharacterized protein n=1 Tax=Pseudocohnilembus persalinus TaxID=266149 RepID=A0A0V0QUQ3_PSEPJ|nr:hypothetical protein PPERSA_02369 [Pseudocohnilembus persalinus]|eukprot:KRX05837.1 hypothetical protein PPERSA_02369 [Pseudocohnilembus persalinus]